MVEASSSTLAQRLLSATGLSSGLNRAAIERLECNSSPPSWPVLIALLSLSLFSEGITVVVSATNAEGERLAGDLKTILGDQVVRFFPAWETLPFERVSPTSETMGKRLEVISGLRRREELSFSIVVAPIRALIQFIQPELVGMEPLVIRTGDTIDLNLVVSQFIDYGYRREYQVENRGEFSVRGSIVDIFPPNLAEPVRIDLFGDEIESISSFDIDDQRSLDSLGMVNLLPAREMFLSPRVKERARELSLTLGFGAQNLTKLSQGEHFDGMESWLPWLTDSEVLLTDLLRAEDGVVLADPSRLSGRARDLVDEEDSLAGSLSATWGAPEELQLPRLHCSFDRLLSNSAAELFPLGVHSGTSLGVLGWEVNGREIAQLMEKARSLLSSGYAVIVAVELDMAALAIQRSFSNEGISARVIGLKEWEFQSGSIAIISKLSLSQGMIIHPAKLAILTETDLTGRRRPHRLDSKRAKRTTNDFEAFGGYVVHEMHGVARYLGMTRRSISGVERDYLLLEYRAGDQLYVPTDQMHLLTPYSGGESPSLSRLGGGDWQRARSRVREAVQEVAQELIVLYQKRTVAPGFSFSPDTAWQGELEALFPYELTPDQARTVEEVKADMQNPRPMDRLVCGDVGFGKTEIAIRAAFKAVQDGKQVAILVPTTLLAQQHHQTFLERFANHPVRVEVLSRFLSPSQARSVVEGIRNGTVDLVVGTHRLLASDISFHDLGLLVVDEEQRFGVTHKELMKKLSTGVDVLTLSATPIPRTLEMSLTGIRDLSLLHTPPAQRRPILTHVGEYDELAVKEAIRRELLREGQVFFVHNRVKDIASVAARLAQLVPEARIAVAHGQMDEASLERVVIEFSEGSYDVLVCTTIIESGIDMPTVNTLVVDRADRLGLGQLHQLRGRVGRSGIRAYAYLLYPPDTSLSDEAYERLRTIGEHSELGSGFRIAMRDLEIRGAGNLLGENQSGHMAAVGYDLYVKMVQEAVAELKGEIFEPPQEIRMDIPGDAYIPASYLGREDLRLGIYKRLALTKEASEVEVIGEELLDRFGPRPEPVEVLLSMFSLRAILYSYGVREASVRKSPTSYSRSELRMSPLKLKASQAMKLKRLFPKAIYKETNSEVVVPLDSMKELDEVSRFVKAILDPRVSVAN